MCWREKIWMKKKVRREYLSDWNKLTLRSFSSVLIFLFICSNWNFIYLLYEVAFYVCIWRIIDQTIRLVDFEWFSFLRLKFTLFLRPISCLCAIWLIKSKYFPFSRVICFARYAFQFECVFDTFECACCSCCCCPLMDVAFSLFNYISLLFILIYCEIKL